MLTSGFWKAKILKSAKKNFKSLFWKAKISKWAKILNTGFWKGKILNSGSWKGIILT